MILSCYLVIIVLLIIIYSFFRDLKKNGKLLIIIKLSLFGVLFLIKVVVI